jgi:integral membrane protein
MTGYSRRTFEVVAFLEGLSFLLLLGVAMPLKHFAGIPLATRVVGLLHGLAFLSYVVVLLDAWASRQRTGRTIALGLLAGFLPAGTFVFVRRLRRLDAELRQGAASGPAVSERATPAGPTAGAPGAAR